MNVLNDQAHIDLSQTTTNWDVLVVTRILTADALEKLAKSEFAASNRLRMYPVWFTNSLASALTFYAEFKTRFESSHIVLVCVCASRERTACHAWASCTKKHSLFYIIG
jgi:hypothetical protein